ncbi:hypothetical protein Egran_06493, partial [Elaphomyces granulatus]
EELGRDVTKVDGHAKELATTTAAEKAPGFPGKQSRSSRKAIVNGHFDIFVDSEDATYDVCGDDASYGYNTKAELPLRLAPANSRLSCLTQEKEESEDDNDKENRFVDDEAEEASEAESEHSQEESEADSEDENIVEDGENKLPSTPRSHQRKIQRGRHAVQMFTRYRESRVETGDIETGEEGMEDDGFNSLDDFVVSDNEAISYESSSFLPDDDDDELEKTPPPKPRKRLVRGRRPVGALKGQLKDHNPDHSGLFSPHEQVSKILDTEALTKIGGINLPPLFPTAHRDQNIMKEGNSDNILSLSEADSPVKRHQITVITTPPHSPSKPRLQSPSKEKYRIPPSPHRESIDAFWSQEAINEWNDKFSPEKDKTPGRALQRLRLALGESVEEEDLSTITLDERNPKSPSKIALKKAEAERKKQALARKQSFDDKKTSFAEEFLKFLDDEVSEGKVQKLAERTGGIRIIWSKTLQTTAGRASWKREKLRDRNQPAAEQVQIRHHAAIELAERIIDCEDRLLNTLAHEYCHLANFMVSNIRDKPHGASFKEWGRKCMQAVKGHPVYGGRMEVTTKHTYKINYKYLWVCECCGQEYGRHSKSIDTTKSKCGLCKGTLHQIRPKPRNTNAGSSSPRKKKTAADGGDSEEVVTVVQEVEEVVNGIEVISLL